MQVNSATIEKSVSRNPVLVMALISLIGYDKTFRLLRKPTLMSKQYEMWLKS